MFIRNSSIILFAGGSSRFELFVQLIILSGNLLHMVANHMVLSFSQENSELLLHGGRLHVALRLIRAACFHGIRGQCVKLLAISFYLYLICTQR